LVVWLFVCLVGLLVVWLVGWFILVGWIFYVKLVDQFDGCLFGWLVGLLVVWLVGWLIGWLIC
jgi:hypothetical protein